MPVQLEADLTFNGRPLGVGAPRLTKAFEREFYGKVGEKLNLIAGAFETELRKTTPQLTGRLRRGWRIRAVGTGKSWQIQVSNTQPYASYLQWAPSSPHRGFVTRAWITALRKTLA